MMLYKSSNQIVKKAAKERIFLEQYPKGNTGQKYLKRNFQKEVKCNIYINKIFLSVKRGMGPTADVEELQLHTYVKSSK